MAWFRREERDVLRGRPEDRWLALISTHAPGKSFLDVGCMWRVNGGYSFHALEAGAARVVGLDIDPATPEFDARNRSAGSRVDFVQGDVNDPRLADTLGKFDVVFCSGVLYHVPNPIQTLERLRGLCGGTLILTTAIVPELEVPQGAVFFPQLDAEARQRLTFSGSHTKVGVDTDFEPDKGYANWFWGMSPSCVRVLLDIAGFDVAEFLRHRYVVTAVATPRPLRNPQAVTHHGEPI
jgi:2-polyprenyl-3-methyl-5-hydroxy-6-metoxy-1,4-benzoquinol methylase